MKRGWPTPSALSRCPCLTGTPVTRAAAPGPPRKTDFISHDVRTAVSGLPVRSQRGNAIFILVRCDLFAVSIKAVSDAEGSSFSPLRNGLVCASRFDVCHHPASDVLLAIKHLYL